MSRWEEDLLKAVESARKGAMRGSRARRFASASEGFDRRSVPAYGFHLAAEKSAGGYSSRKESSKGQHSLPEILNRLPI